MTVTAGIDVHHKQWNVSVFLEDRNFKTFQQAPSAEALREYIDNNFPGADIRAGYESGFSGFSTYRALELVGIRTMVINASDVPAADKDRRRKTDKRDAVRIAKAINAGQVEGVYVPTEQQEADRRMVRMRTETIRKEINRNKNRIKAFLKLHGLKGPDNDGEKWSVAYVEWLKGLRFRYSSDQVSFGLLMDTYDFHEEQRRKIEKEIRELSKEPRHADIYRSLTSMKGIGLLTSMSLITELIDMRRFPDLDHVASYIGLVPDVSASDSNIKVKGVTGRTNGNCRRLLVQSAWTASGTDPVMARHYHGWKKRMIAQKAIIKLSRKMLSVIRSLWLSGDTYRPVMTTE